MHGCFRTVIGMLLMMLIIAFVFICNAQSAQSDTRCLNKSLAIDNFYQHCKYVVGTMTLQKRAAVGQNWILSDAQKVKDYCVCLCQRYKVETLANSQCMVNDVNVLYVIRNDKALMHCMAKRPW